MLEIAKVYPLDAVFDTPEDVPDDVSFLWLLMPLSNAMCNVLYKGLPLGSCMRSGEFSCMRLSLSVFCRVVYQICESQLCETLAD
jgi:hypothetical protein